MDNLSSELEQLGLTKLESKIYLGPLEKGPSTILNLSRYLKLNRTTVHITVESLVRKGLATELKVGGKRQITEEPPEKLKTIIENERVETSKKEKKIPGLIEGIYDLVANIRENTDAEVKYFVGAKAISKIYDEAVNAKEYRAYVKPQLIWNLLPENKEKFLQAAKNGCKLKEIAEYSQYTEGFVNEYKDYPNFEFKFLPKQVNINSIDYMLYSNTTAIVNLLEEPTAILIRNKFLYENSKIFFDLFWETLT